MTAYYYTGWRLVRTLFQILFGFRQLGLENVPMDGPAIIASNHQSNLDPPVVGTGIKRACHFFAKKELFDKFILGPAIVGFNSIPVRRGVYDPVSLERAVKALKDGGLLIMFPEGTRDDGKSFLPAKPGVGFLARQAEVPIVPAFIEGSRQLGRALRRRPPLSVTYGKPILCEDMVRFSNDKAGHKELASYVMERIAELKSRRSMNWD